MMIDAGLVIAVLKRREQAAKDKAAKLDKDPALKSAAHAERAIQGAVAKLRITIEDYVKANNDDTAQGVKTG